MITNQEWERLEKLLDRKLEQKLDEKLVAFEQKFDQKLVVLEQKIEQKFDNFAILMKNAFDEVHHKIDTALVRLNGHETRLDIAENNIQELKSLKHC